MGFDNECILNIQTLAGEYFCPVCRLLVYPNEALQSQCTHLYCKPCLTYIVSTTRACPYDGYLVTEADSKLLVESNKTLAETIGKIAVHCLYHRSGCTWQGPLSECTSHCAGCAFGNSPVVCNRCGIQIVHRQVQEHAQNCPGVQPQVQQAEGAQDTSAAGGTDAANQTQAGVTATQAQTTQAAATTTSGQDPNQQANPNSQSQALVQSAVPTPEQWYQQQQQYQQYYQQYPGYDPYQQHYQQYYPYQQPGVPQYHQQHLQAHPPHVAGQNQPLLQPQSQPQTLVQPQSQPQPQPIGQPQSQTHAQAPAVAQLQNQAQVNLQQQPPTAVLPHSQIQSQTPQPAPGQPHPHPQPYPQAHLHPTQAHPQQHVMVPQYQQPHHQMQHLQPQPHSAHHQAPAQQHSQPHPHLNSNVQHQMQHPPAHDVTGHQSYPQPHQQMHLVAPQQHTMHMNPQGGPHPLPQHSGQAPSQFPQQHPPMRPPPPIASIPNQQQAALLPLPSQVQNIHPAQQQPVQQSGHPIHQRPPPIQPGQQIIAQQHVQQQLQPFVLQSPFLQQQMPTPSPLRPQVPPHSYTQHTHAYPQLQQNAAFSHGSQNVAGRPMVPNHAVQSQPYPQYAGGVQARPLHPGASQPSASLNNMLRSEIQVQVSTEQQSGATLRSTMSLRQGDYGFEKGMGDQAVELSSEEAAKKILNDSDPASTSALGGDASEVKRTDIKSKDDCESRALGNGGLVKQMVKEEGVESNLDIFNVSKSGELVSEIKKDVSEVSPRHLGNFASEDRESKDDLLLKKPPLHEPEQIEKLGGKLEKDASAFQQASMGANEASQTLTTTSASVSSSPAKNVIPKGAISQGLEGNDGYKGLPPPSQVHSGGFTQPSHPGSIADQGRHFGPSSLQQRPGAPLLQAPSFVLPHPQHPGGHPSSQFRPQGYGHIPEQLQHPASKQSLETPPGGILGPGSTSSFGRGPGYYDFPQRNFESLPVVSQGPHGPGHALPTNAVASRVSQGDSVGGPPYGMLPPGVVDSRGGMMTRPHGPEGLMGQQRPTNPMDGELFLNHRPSYMDSRRPDPHLPGSLGRGSVGQPSGVMGSNGAPGLDSSSTLGLRDDRSKPFPDDRFNSFVGREGADRGEFEDGLKQFPRPSHLDGDFVPKFGNYASRPREMGPYGLNSDTGFKLGPGAGSAHSGFLPPYDGGERPVGLPDSGRNHPDFLGPVTGYARRHMNGPTPRSPIREYHGISSRGFGGIPGQSGLDDFDGNESRRFGDPIGNSFHESRFPILPGHMHRGEFEGPGKLRMGEHLGPRNLHSHLRLGEPIGFGDYPGHARMGELPGLGDFESYGAGNRPGHARFRSSYPLQGFPNDRGINTGDTESFGNPRKRKATSTGWCRICKVDCQTVGGLELHSQTREHQKMAMDMVRTIKQNAKKQKLSSSDPSLVEDAIKSKNTSFDGHGNKH